MSRINYYIKRHSSLIVFITVTALLITCSIKAVTSYSQNDQDNKKDKPMTVISPEKKKLFDGETNAPDFTAGLEWLNTERPISIRDLRGKIVLLDFWTYCCINCMHIIPDLKKLEKKYADQLVVIGVHSAKFLNERDTDNIRQAILRYEIEHPVVNDLNMEVWNQYTARSWPTLVLINPKGKIVGRVSGEGIFDPFDKIISEMIPYFREQKVLNDKPINYKLEKFSAPAGVLSYPGKVLADEKGGRLFISDSNHNRIIITSLDGKLSDVIGDGELGNKDGSFAEVEFNHPQGIALDGDNLYICDTENHLIRKANLSTRTVETIIGTGQQADRFNIAGTGTKVAINSPWDALVHEGTLYVAMAGFHQLWSIDLKTLEAKPYAGSGRENIVDGKLYESALAQPSGVTTDGKSIYFADSEVSAIRYASLPNGNQVTTIVGTGLFDFGDKDGTGNSVKLQHPLGVVYVRGKLYVADTYNSKIKEIIVDKQESKTFAGSRDKGMRDGEAKKSSFNEPGGISATTKNLFVADTNNHSIRKIDLDSGEVSTLQLTGLEKLTKHTTRKFRGRTVAADKQTIAPGGGNISLSFSLPSGFKYNAGAPFYIAYKSDDDKVVKITAKENIVSFTEPKFPFEIPIETYKGQTNAVIDAVVYYCNDDKEKVCLVDSLRINVPIEVSDNASKTAKINIQVKK